METRAEETLDGQRAVLYALIRIPLWVLIKDLFVFLKHPKKGLKTPFHPSA
jgi:hypothetical protein